MPPLLPYFAVNPSSTLAATDLFSYSFAFPVCYINSVMWYVTFWICLLSVSTVHFRLIHVLVCIHTSLVFYCWGVFCCMGVPQFLHSPIEGCLDCFHFWVNHDFEKSCYIHSCTGFCVNLSFHFSWRDTQMAGSYGNSV